MPWLVSSLSDSLLGVLTSNQCARTVFVRGFEISIRVSPLLSPKPCSFFLCPLLATFFSRKVSRSLAFPEPWFDLLGGCLSAFFFFPILHKKVNFDSGIISSMHYSSTYSIITVRMNPSSRKDLELKGTEGAPTPCQPPPTQSSQINQSISQITSQWISGTNTRRSSVSSPFGFFGNPLKVKFSAKRLGEVRVWERRQVAIGCFGRSVSFLVCKLMYERHLPKVVRWRAGMET